MSTGNKWAIHLLYLKPFLSYEINYDIFSLKYTLTLTYVYICIIVNIAGWAKLMQASSLIEDTFYIWELIFFHKELNVRRKKVDKNE